MESLTLKCPLCCEGTFSSHQSLKYHILSITENLFCPACDKRFYNLTDLTDHLGTECKEQETKPIIHKDESGEKKLSQAMSKPSQELLDPKVEVDSEEESYFCHMCNINILSVETHLSEYHQGEDIVMVYMNYNFFYCKCI